MSRAPPFPTRRRSPSVTDGVSYMPSSAPGTSTTRPLQISRVGSRATTPDNSLPSYATPNTAPLGPSRPQRSELRARAEYSESERASISSSDPYRDSTSTSRPDNPSLTPYRVAPKSKSANNVSTATGNPQNLDYISVNGDQKISPSLNSALSAFRSAGSRKGQNLDVVDDHNYQRDRELEIEAEKAKQQRIRDKGLGFRTKGNVKRGEIDGMSIIYTSVTQLQILTTFFYDNSRS